MSSVAFVAAESKLNILLDIPFCDRNSNSLEFSGKIRINCGKIIGLFKLINHGHGGNSKWLGVECSYRCNM